MIPRQRRRSHENARRDFKPAGRDLLNDVTIRAGFNRGQRGV
jgi:hypothetical protein